MKKFLAMVLAVVLVLGAFGGTAVFAAGETASSVWLPYRMASFSGQTFVESPEAPKRHKYIELEENGALTLEVKAGGTLEYVNANGKLTLKGYNNPVVISAWNGNVTSESENVVLDRGNFFENTAKGTKYKISFALTDKSANGDEVEAVVKVAPIEKITEGDTVSYQTVEALARTFEQQAANESEFSYNFAMPDKAQHEIVSFEISVKTISAEQSEYDGVKTVSIHSLTIEKAADFEDWEGYKALELKSGAKAQKITDANKYVELPTGMAMEAVSGGKISVLGGGASNIYFQRNNSLLSVKPWIDAAVDSALDRGDLFEGKKKGEVYKIDFSVKDGPKTVGAAEIESIVKIAPVEMLTAQDGTVTYQTVDLMAKTFAQQSITERTSFTYYFEMPAPNEHNIVSFEISSTAYSKNANTGVWAKDNSTLKSFAVFAVSVQKAVAPNSWSLYKATSFSSGMSVPTNTNISVADENGTKNGAHVYKTDGTFNFIGSCSNKFDSASINGGGEYLNLKGFNKTTAIEIYGGTSLSERTSLFDAYVPDTKYRISFDAKVSPSVDINSLTVAPIRKTTAEGGTVTFEKAADMAATMQTSEAIFSNDFERFSYTFKMQEDIVGLAISCELINGNASRSFGIDNILIEKSIPQTSESGVIEIKQVDDGYMLYDSENLYKNAVIVAGEYTSGGKLENVGIGKTNEMLIGSAASGSVIKVFAVDGVNSLKPLFNEKIEYNVSASK